MENVKKEEKLCDRIIRMKILASFSVWYAPVANPDWVEKIRTNEKEALKFFLNAYAYGGRAGAPKSFSIIATHCVEENWTQNANIIWERFQELVPRPNQNTNPLYPGDNGGNKVSAIGHFNFQQQILENLQNGDPQSAHEHLTQIRGVGRKIASFFLRDIAYFFKINTANWGPDKFKWLQPIDRWVGKVSEILGIDGGQDLPTNICSVCIRNGISPLKFNQGAWYFSSAIAGTDEYLLVLLEGPPENMIRSALHLASFLPSDYPDKLRQELKNNGVDRYFI
jgi:hypothetical protein